MTEGDGRSKVLVVDDDPQILRALRINLSAHGYHVTVAIDGATALRAAGAVRPDLVVLDLSDPRDGTSSSGASPARRSARSSSGPRAPTRRRRSPRSTPGPTTT